MKKSGLRLFSISSFSLFDEIKAISIPEKKRLKRATPIKQQEQMSESYCYTVNNRLFSYQYTRNPIVTNEIASNHLNFQQTKFAGRFHGETGSVYQDSCLCSSKAYFMHTFSRTKILEISIHWKSKEFLQAISPLKPKNRYIFDILSMQQKGRIQIQPFRCLIKETGDQISCCRQTE